MATRRIGWIWENRWSRVVGAVLLVIIGLVPVGEATITGTDASPTVRVEQPAAVVTYVYSWEISQNGSTEISRTADSGGTWQELSPVPEGVLQLGRNDPNGHHVYALGETMIWRLDTETSEWSSMTKLPSRPTSMAVGIHSPGLLYVGTESLGLFRSRDGGQNWENVSGFLPAGDVAPVSVTAVALHPEDERIVYVSAGYWLGTSKAHFAPVLTAMSVDNGRHWFTVEKAALGSEAVTQLYPNPYTPLILTEVGPSDIRNLELMITSELIVGLHNPDPLARAAVARLVGLSGSSVYLTNLLERLGDPDYTAGTELALAIGRLGNEAAVPVLKEALASVDEGKRAQAATALGLLQIEEVIPQLAVMLRSDSSWERQSAATALATMGTPHAIAALIEPLSDETLTPALHVAMAALEAIGEPALGQLTAAARHPNAAVRKNSVDVLGWIASAQSVPVLAEALSDDSPTVRSRAAWSLGQIGTSSAQAALRQALNDVKSDPLVHSSVATALERAEERSGAWGQPVKSPANALLDVMTSVSLERWIFLGFALVLAAIFVMGMPAKLRFGGR